MVSTATSNEGDPSSGGGDAGRGTWCASGIGTGIGADSEANKGAGATGGVARGCGKCADMGAGAEAVGGDKGRGMVSGEVAAASGGAGETRSLGAGVEPSLASPTTNLARSLSSRVRLGRSGVPGEDADAGGGVCVRGGETRVLRSELSGSPKGSSAPAPLPFESERSCLAAPSTKVRRPENIEERVQPMRALLLRVSYLRVGLTCCSN